MDIKELKEKGRYGLDDLRYVFKCLRGENGCPWDREQTHESIRANLIEETYEVVEAIDKADLKLMKEELGDLLLQVVFHAGIEEENGSFTLDDVISDVTEKLIRRHPHVFGDVRAEDAEGALNFWDAAKSIEKTERKTAVISMQAVPPSLPALMRAQKISKKATKDGYDIESHIISAADNVKMLSEYMRTPNVAEDGIADRIGDALYSISAFSERISVDAEHELNRRSEKFIYEYSERQKS